MTLLGRWLPLVVTPLAVALVGCVQVPDPVFQIELWPGEGIPNFETTGELLRLHEAPNQGSSVIHEVEPTSGTQVEFDQTRYQTWKPGLMEAIEVALISGRDMGTVQHLTRDQYYGVDFVRREWQVAPADTIQYLQYRAEGTCFVRIEGVVVDTDRCPTLMQEAFRTLTEPVTEWWIHATVENRTGWLLVDQSLRSQRSF